MSLFGKSNAGFLGGMFDFNQDGKMDPLERAAELTALYLILDDQEKEEEDIEEDEEDEDEEEEEDDDWDETDDDNL